MNSNPFEITEAFERAVAKYTGAPHAVAVDSCTNAIFLCCKYHNVKEVAIPSDIYISPAMSIINSGGTIVFDKNRNGWQGIYKLGRYPIYDCAKRFTSRMHIRDTMMCLSFHAQKHLKLGKGGMILVSSVDEYDWLRKARYEGRTPGIPLFADPISMIGWNMYMPHQIAALGLSLMQNMPEHNEDIPNDYRDLTTFPVFDKCKVIELNQVEV